MFHSQCSIVRSLSEAGFLSLVSGQGLGGPEVLWGAGQSVWEFDLGAHDQFREFSTGIRRAKYIYI